MNEMRKNKAVKDSDTRASGDVKLRVELGRTKLSDDQLSALDVGSVLEFDSSADKVELRLADGVVATGEAVAVNDELGVRVREVIRRARQAARKAGWTGEEGNT